MFERVLKRIFGSKHGREIKKLQPLVDGINALEDEIRRLDDAGLQGKRAEFRALLAKGTPLDAPLLLRQEGELPLPLLPVVRQEVVNTTAHLFFSVVKVFEIYYLSLRES